MDCRAAETNPPHDRVAGSDFRLFGTSSASITLDFRTNQQPDAERKIEKESVMIFTFSTIYKYTHIHRQNYFFFLRIKDIKQTHRLG